MQKKVNFASQVELQSLTKATWKILKGSKLLDALLILVLSIKNSAWLRPNWAPVDHSNADPAPPIERFRKPRTGRDFQRTSESLSWQQTHPKWHEFVWNRGFTTYFLISANFSANVHGQNMAELRDLNLGSLWYHIFRHRQYWSMSLSSSPDGSA